MESGVFWFIVILVRLIAGVISAIIAHHKGRSVAGWFFGGFALELIGIIIVAVLPNRKAELARLQYAENERRRLREQLHQERMKSEAFRQYSLTRLDQHDDLLGVDTRPAGALPGGAGPVGQLPGASYAGGALAREGAGRLAPPGGIPPIQEPGSPWFYVLRGERHGPVSEQQMREFLGAMQIAPETLVWTEGMVDWTPLRQVPRLASGLRA